MNSHDLEVATAHQLYAAFNDPTVDGVMAYFADHAVYEDPLGRRHVDSTAVRAALAPSFNGSQRYTLRDLFSANGVIVATWTLEVGPDNGRVRLDGMDILKFASRKILLKQC